MASGKCLPTYRGIAAVHLKSQMFYGTEDPSVGIVSLVSCIPHQIHLYFPCSHNYYSSITTLVF